MSNSAITAVFRFSTAKGSERCLMIAVADGINTDSERYIAGKGKLASRANIERRWVRRLVGRSIARGELIVWEGQGGERNVYAIPILPGEPGYEEAPCTDQSHICIGKHTPLTVSREAPNRVAMGTRGQQRKSGGRGLQTPPPNAKGVEGGLQTTTLGAYRPPSRGLEAPNQGPEDPPIPILTHSLPNEIPMRTRPQAPSYTDWKQTQPASDRDHYDRKASAGLLAYRVWCQSEGLEPRT